MAKSTVMNDANLTEALEAVQAEITENVEAAVEEIPIAVEKPAHKRERSQKYVAARSMVDRTRSYDIREAVELVKRTSYSKFDATITAHINLKRDLKPVDVTLPHSTGKSVRVAIVSDEVIAELEAGQINFDVLVATPDTMKKLVKFARLLGPKGLMPNPKMGTVSADPETKKAELEKGAITLKQEKKAPLLHVRVGKKSLKDEQLVENIEALIKAVNPMNIDKLTIVSTMGPGIKVTVV